MESGAALLVDEEPAGPEAAASYVGIDSSGALRTLLPLPPLSPPVHPDAAPMPPASDVVSMAFSRDEESLALGTSAGVVAVHSLPRTKEQHRQRSLLLQIRGQVPRPVPYGAFGPELAPCKAGACLLPPATPRVSALVFSLSGAHVFVFGPAGTVSAVAIKGGGEVVAVPEDKVGGAEWPKEPGEAAAASASLCDSGALLAGRFHPVRRGQRLPLREHPNLAPTTDVDARGGGGAQHGKPHRKPRASLRPVGLKERLKDATVGAGIAAVCGQLGRLDVHSGLHWTTRAHTEGAHVVSHVAWTADQRLAVTGDSHGDRCLCVWEQR